MVGLPESAVETIMADMAADMEVDTEDTADMVDMADTAADIAVDSEE